MSLQRNVHTGIHLSKPTDPIAAPADGFKCACTSCACGRGTTGTRRLHVGQKVTSDLFLKQKQEIARYNLLVFVIKLLGKRSKI